MSKRILVVLIAALAVVILVAGLSTLQNRGGESSEEESSLPTTQIIIVPSEIPERISLELPPGFTEQHSEAYNKYYVRDDASVFLTGEKMTVRGIRLDEYTASVKAQYRQTADEFSLISEETVSLRGNVQCTVLEFTYAIVGENARQDMQCVTAVIVKDNRAYLVTCKSKQETFQTYRAAFLRMIESIRIADSDDTPAENTETVPAANG